MYYFFYHRYTRELSFDESLLVARTFDVCVRKTCRSRQARLFRLSCARLWRVAIFSQAAYFFSTVTRWISLFPPCGTLSRLYRRIGRARRWRRQRHRHRDGRARERMAPFSLSLSRVAEYERRVYERAGYEAATTRRRCNVTRWRLGDDGWSVGSVAVYDRLVSLASPRLASSRSVPGRRDVNQCLFRGLRNRLD